MIILYSSAHTFIEESEICLFRGGALDFLMLTGFARTESRPVPSLLFLRALLCPPRSARSPRKVRLSRFWEWPMMAFLFFWPSVLLLRRVLLGEECVTCSLFLM